MIQKPAQTSVPISDLLANRWSPRIFDRNHIITPAEITRLQEAARWAPSGNNAQPWKFSFTPRGEQMFEELSSTALTGFNQQWAPSASLFVVAFAEQNKEDGSPLERHASYFNNALATSQVVFEAESMGLKAHYMGGILHDRILEIYGLTNLWVTCILAIGKQGDTESASQELASREMAARSRKELSQIFL